MKKDKKSLLLNMSPEEYKMIKEMAETSYISLSQYVRLLIHEAYRKFKK